MAVVKCKECGNQVSTKAKACPACGAKPAKRVGVLGWLFVLLVVLPIAWRVGSNMGEPVSGASPSASLPTKTSEPAQQPAQSGWSRHEYKDDMTDKKVVVLSLKSKNSASFDFPYKQAGGSYLTMNLRRGDGSLESFMVIDRGQMQCGIRNCSFDLRVGDGPVQKWTGLSSTTNDRDLMFVRDARQLESIIKSGKPFRIGIEFFQAGVRVFEFDPTGYPGL